jgi:HEAT repeat protein
MVKLLTAGHPEEMIKTFLFILLFAIFSNGCAPGRQEIADWGRDKNVKKLIAVLNTRGSPHRAHAASFLGEIGGREAVASLLSVLTENNPELQRASISALGRIGDKRAVAPLAALLKKGYSGLSSQTPPTRIPHRKGRPAPETEDDNQKETLVRARLRLEAVRALGNIGDAGAAEIISGAIWDGRSEEVALSAVEALAKLEGGDTASILAESFRVCNFRIRETTAQALARLRPSPPQPCLSSLEG